MCIFMWRNLSDSKSSTPCPGLFHSLLKPHPHFSVSYSYVPSLPFKNILVNPHSLQNKMQIFCISIQDSLSSFPDLASSVPPIVTIQSQVPSCFHVCAHVTHLLPISHTSVHGQLIFILGLSLPQMQTLRQELECESFIWELMPGSTGKGKENEPEWKQSSKRCVIKPLTTVGN